MQFLRKFEPFSRKLGVTLAPSTYDIKFQSFFSSGSLNISLCYGTIIRGSLPVKSKKLNQMSENLVFFLPSTSFDACSSDVRNAVPLT